MGASVNSGGVTATISGNVTSIPAFPVLGATQTAVKAGTNYLGASIGTGGTTLYTPTGGKTFYLTSLTVVPYSGAANYHVSDGPSTPFIAGGGATSSTQVYTFALPLKITTDVRLFNNATITSGWSLTGFEQ